jgi:hypothetical protein
MRFNRPHDAEDEATRLLAKPRGKVAVWADGSVSWFKADGTPAVIHPDDAPIYIACPLPGAVARKRYTEAIREWWRRDNEGRNER